MVEGGSLRKNGEVVPGGGISAQFDRAFPFLFWRVSVAALSSPTPGDARVRLG